MIKNPVLFKNNKLYTDNMGKALPNPSLQPLSVNYCKLSKEKFVSVIERVSELIALKYDTTVTVGIEVPGFDASFESAEDLTKAHNRHKWAKLKEVDASFFVGENKDPAVRIKAGSPILESGEEVGLRAEMVFGDYDKQLALRQSIEQLLPDYTRKVFPQRYGFAALAGLLVAIPLGLKVYPDNNPASGLDIFGTLLFIAMFWLGTGVVLYHFHLFMFPLLELVGDDEKTRWGKLLRLIGKTVGFIIALSALLAIIKAIFK